MERCLLTPAEVAKTLRTSLGQLANLRMRGEGPPYLKFHRKVLYESRELDQWLDQHRIKTEV